MFKISFYVPETHVDVVKTAMFAAGAGKIGNYDSCAWQCKGEGQYRPLEGSDPYLGQKGKVEQVDEFKVEMVCAAEKIREVVSAMKAAHPYETPAYNVTKLELL